MTDLRALAEQRATKSATADPCETCGHTYKEHSLDWGGESICHFEAPDQHPCEYTSRSSRASQDYIAALSPDTVLALLDVVDAAKAVSEIEWHPCGERDDPEFLAKYPPPQVQFYERLRDAVARVEKG